MLFLQKSYVSLFMVIGKFQQFQYMAINSTRQSDGMCIEPPQFVPFHPVVIAEQDRGNYTARKIVFNLTADSRVLGYLLVPKEKDHSLLSCFCMIMVRNLTSEKKKLLNLSVFYLRK